MDRTWQARNYLLLLLVQLAWLPTFVLGKEVDPPLIQLQSLDCVINPSVVADLGSSVPGVLKSVLVDRGDFVNAGDVIAQLESGVDMASLKLARTRVALTSEIDLRRTNAAFGERQSKRIADLYKRSMISSKEMDQTQTETKLTQLQLNQALDNQKLAQMELIRAQEVVDRHTIKSPISGVIMERFKTLGEYVDDQPIVRIAQLSPLNVEVIIPVSQMGKVHTGMFADVWAEGINEKWHAKVSRIDRVADVASGTYGVRLTLKNPEYKIPAGLRCRVSFLDSESTTQTDIASVSEALILPSLRLIENQARAQLTVNKNSHIEKKLADINHSEIEQCGRLGPYSDKLAAQKKALMLKVDGVDVSIQTTTENVQTGVLVMSPAFASAKQINAYLKRLRAVGDKDYFQLARKANQPYQLSLGVYSAIEGSVRRVKKLRSKGLRVITKPRYIKQNRYWLLMKGKFSLLDSETQLQLADAAQDLGITSCNLNIATHNSK